MHRQFVSWLFAGFIIAVAAVPLVNTHAIFRSIDDEGNMIFPAEDIRSLVKQHRTTAWRLKRRMYSRAVEIYRDLVRKGVQGLTPPDINDMGSIVRYLDEETFSEYIAEVEREQAHGAAPSLQQQIDELPYQDQLRLIGFAQTGRCPEALRLSYLQGFYELCQRLVEEGLTPQPVEGLRDESKGLRGLLFHEAGPKQTLKLRLEMLEQARDPRNRRLNIPVERYRFRRD